jgi:hypothetical protein
MVRGKKTKIYHTMAFCGIIEISQPLKLIQNLVFQLNEVGAESGKT